MDVLSQSNQPLLFLPNVTANRDVDEHSNDYSGCSTTSQVQLSSLQVKPSVLRCLRRMLNRPYQLDTHVYSQLMWSILKVGHNDRLEAAFCNTFSLDKTALQTVLDWAGLHFEASFNSLAANESKISVKWIVGRLEHCSSFRKTSRQLSPRTRFPVAALNREQSPEHNRSDGSPRSSKRLIGCTAPSVVECAVEALDGVEPLALASRLLSVIHDFLRSLGQRQAAQRPVNDAVPGMASTSTAAALAHGSPQDSCSPKHQALLRNYSWETVSYMAPELSFDSDVSRIQAIRSKKGGSVASMQSIVASKYADSTGSDIKHTLDVAEGTSAQQTPRRVNSMDNLINAKAASSSNLPLKHNNILAKLKEILVSRMTCIRPRTRRHSLKKHPDFSSASESKGRNGLSRRRSGPQAFHPRPRQSFEMWIREQEPETPSRSFSSPKLSGSSENQPVSNTSSKLVLTANWVNTGHTCVDCEAPPSPNSSATTSQHAHEAKNIHSQASNSATAWTSHAGPSAGCAPIVIERPPLGVCDEIQEAGSWASMGSKPRGLLASEIESLDSTPDLISTTPVTNTSSQSAYARSPFAIALEQEYHDPPPSPPGSPHQPSFEIHFPQQVFHTPHAATAPPLVMSPISPISPSDMGSRPHTISPSMVLLGRSTNSSWASESNAVSPGAPAGEPQSSPEAHTSSSPQPVSLYANSSWASEASQSSMAASPGSSALPHPPRIRTTPHAGDMLSNMHHSYSLNYYIPRRDSWSSDYSAHSPVPRNLDFSYPQQQLQQQQTSLPSGLRSATSMPSRLGGRRHMSRALSGRTAALAAITTTTAELNAADRDTGDAAAATPNSTTNSAEPSPTAPDTNASAQESEIDTHFLSDRGATITESADLDMVVTTTSSSASAANGGLPRAIDPFSSTVFIPDPSFHFTLSPMEGAGRGNSFTNLPDTAVALVPEPPSGPSSSEISDGSATRGGLSLLGVRLSLATRSVHSSSSAEDEEAPETLCHFGSFTGATEPAYLAAGGGKRPSAAEARK